MPDYLRSTTLSPGIIGGENNFLFKEEKNCCGRKFGGALEKIPGKGPGSRRWQRGFELTLIPGRQPFPEGIHGPGDEPPDEHHPVQVV
jgi:hypothetical protein